MKIAIVGWGYIPTPPLSNSVSTLMNEWTFFLKAAGHQVDLINEKDPDLTIQYLKEGGYDFIHSHAHPYIDSFNQKLPQKYCLTCHHGYLLKEDKWEAELKQYFSSILSVPGLIVHSHLAADFLRKQRYSGYIGVLPSGIDPQKIAFKEQGNHKALCLGWIQPRKQQTLLAGVVDGEIELDFVGPLDDPDFQEGKTTKYLGIWSLPQVYQNLTDYSCLVLISDGESAAPLVVLEALAAGLSVVVSESASTNLAQKDFIKVLPDDVLTHKTFENKAIVCDAIRELIDNNQSSRQEIMQYAKDNFDFRVLTPTYLQVIENFKNFTHSLN